MPRSKKEKRERILTVMRNPSALVDGWKCPVCKNEFRNQQDCPHGWSDVKKHNDAWLLQQMGH